MEIYYMATVYNFNAGPAILPRPVLEQAQRELLDYRGIGMSVLEISHRSKEYEVINAEAEARFKRLLGLGDDYRVLFLQGGASLQFAMLPLNFLPPGTTADYLLTGAWAEKAFEEAAQLFAGSIASKTETVEKMFAGAVRIGQARVAASTREQSYRRMPRSDEIQLSDAPAYVHITSNETIQGTQWHAWPDVGDRPFVADMSSDILSRPLEARRFALIYAGAQKNLGPAGATVVLIRQDWLERANSSAPTMLRYATHAKNSSLYNTPPAYAVYLLNLTLGWIEDQGGLSAMAERNQGKAATIYTAIDGSGSFYSGHAEPKSRSLMNVTFRLPTEELEKQFVAEATAAGLVGLAGHRSVGGIRASIYNAMSQEGCAALAHFMGEFLRKHG